MYNVTLIINFICELMTNMKNDIKIKRGGDYFFYNS